MLSLRAWVALNSGDNIPLYSEYLDELELGLKSNEQMVIFSTRKHKNQIENVMLASVEPLLRMMNKDGIGYN
jgi:hypothetical protein